MYCQLSHALTTSPSLPLGGSETRPKDRLNTFWYYGKIASGEIHGPYGTALLCPYQGAFFCIFIRFPCYPTVSSLIKTYSTGTTPYNTGDSWPPESRLRVFDPVLLSSFPPLFPSSRLFLARHSSRFLSPKSFSLGSARQVDTLLLFTISFFPEQLAFLSSRPFFLQ